VKVDVEIGVKKGKFVLNKTQGERRGFGRKQFLKKVIHSPKKCWLSVPAVAV
jgi:hypothetical protein